MVTSSDTCRHEFESLKEEVKLASQGLQGPSGAALGFIIHLGSFL